MFGNQKSKELISYKLNISVSPQWPEVFKWCTQDFNYDVLAEIDSSFDIDGEESLYMRDFRFKSFNDAVSGMQMIWSDHYKTFVNDYGVSGYIFQTKDGLNGIFKKYDYHKRLSHPIVISPVRIGFNTHEDWMSEEDAIAQMPFWEVVNHFLKEPKTELPTHENFDNKLKELLEKSETRCVPNQHGNWGRPDGSYILENKYFNVYFGIKKFWPGI